MLYRQDSVDQLDGATGQPLNETRVVMRRARLRAEAEATYVGATVEIDGNTVQGTQVRLLGGEAWLQWPQRQGSLPYLRAPVGMFKIPFGREVLQYDPERLFLERTQIIRAPFPGAYARGPRLGGGWALLWRGAVRGAGAKRLGGGGSGAAGWVPGTALPAVGAAVSPPAGWQPSRSNSSRPMLLISRQVRFRSSVIMLFSSNPDCCSAVPRPFCE